MTQVETSETGRFPFRFWRHHLAIALRTLRRDPLFAAINLFGLAVGLAACLLIVLFIRYELSFDDSSPAARPGLSHPARPSRAP